MTVYYLVFLFLMIPTLRYKEDLNKKAGIGFLIFGLFLIIFTGLRHHVGGDWNNYIRMFYTILPHLSYPLALEHDDPGFWLLFYATYDIGWGFYGMNFIGAIIFVTGLFKLLNKEPNPWMGLLVAFPYLIIVVSMGYTRQAIALGFIMWGIVYLKNDKFYRFILAVFIAATFHKTAVIMIGIGIFNKGKGKFFKALAALIIGLGMWSAFLAEAQAELIHQYATSGNFQSGGAMLRVVMNVIPAFLLIVLRKRWKIYFNDYNFWFMIALGSIASLFLVSFASTAVDRMALYFIPLQVIVFSRLAILLQHRMSSTFIKFSIITYYFIVLNIWLWMGIFSMWWLPYQNIIFVDLF